MTRLTIILVSYNSKADLEHALRSLMDPPPRVDHEVVVVDNASIDSTTAGFSERWPGVRLIASSSNLGFAKANNLAARSTSSELVLFMNPDTVTPPGAVDRLVAILDAHPEAAVVGPRIVDGRGRAELSFGRMVTPWTELRQKALTTAQAKRLPLGSALVERMSRHAGRVDWVSGACLLIRRADLESVGGFDERFFMYLEDVDLCASIRAKGRFVVFTPDPTVVHLRGRSAATSPLATRVAYRRSHVGFYEKHHPAWAPVLKAYLKIRGQLPDTPS